MVRFLLFAAALTHWVLREPQARRWLWYSLAGATLYLVAQVATQLVTGHNWYGAPVSEDGEITGPFAKPRAGPSYVRMVFPVLVPTGFALLSAAGWGRRAAGLALFAGGLAVSVLIGQRMPLLLLVFGLLIMALLLPRLRLAVGVALVAGAGVLAATVVVAPRAFYRLVIKFSNQMADFPDSPYGQLAGRSIAIARQHLWTGRGYDGFRSGCTLPRYFQAWHWPAALGGQSPVGGDGGGATMCATHPHNWYMQAVTDAGLPGLLLFIALAGAWLYGLSLRGLRGELGRQPDPLRVGLFVAAFIQLWPIESTSPIISLPMGGWFFLLLGFGLAAARSP
jgi:O-antigen ligase